MKAIFLFFSIFLSTNVFGAWGDSENNSYGQQKYSFEDTVVHDSSLKCNELARAGFNKPEQYRVNIGNAKSITLKFETYSAKDNIIVEYEDKQIFNSGCIGTQGWKGFRLKTNGFSEYVTITVLPNCLGHQDSTQWQFILECK